jgi:DNA-binding MurR/RpiR family transcriptional regulator
MRSLSLLIQDHAAVLSPTDRQIADLILSFPGEIASYSANELAKMSGTSNAAVTRFVRRIGFRNYEEMKRHARDMRASGSPIYLMEKNGVRTLSEQIERHVSISLTNITETFSSIDPNVLSEATEGLASARRVVFVGMRNGYFLAQYLRWQISEVRERTELLPTAGETLAETLAGLTDKDVLVVFAIRRILPMISSVLDVARGLKCRTLVIADRYFADSGGYTWLLSCDTRSRSPLDNHVAVLALCHIIADEMMQVLGTVGRKRLSAIEDLHLELKEIGPLVR